MNRERRSGRGDYEDGEPFEFKEGGVTCSSSRKDFRDGLTVTVAANHKVDDAGVLKVCANMVEHHRLYVAPSLGKPVRYSKLTYKVVRL